MSLKLIAGDFSATHAVKVYRDAEYEEYRVKLYKKTDNGLMYVDEADYHTTDKQDALVTSRAMLMGAK